MEENFIRLNWIYALNAVENGDDCPLAESEPQERSIEF